MIYLFIAHKAEARALIERFGLHLQHKSPYPLYSNDTMILCITGMGKTAQKALHDTFKRYPPRQNDRLINAGVAGCTDGGVTIGSVFTVARCLYANDAITLDKEGVSCRSFTAPVTRDFEGFLCDMESYFLLEAAKEYLPLSQCGVYKVVSDHLSDRIPSKEQVQRWMQTLTDVLQTAISEDKPPAAVCKTS